MSSCNRVVFRTSISMLGMLVAVVVVATGFVFAAQSPAYAATYGINGTVKDWPAKTPVGGIVVRVVSAEESDLQNALGSEFTTVTAGDGSFVLSGLSTEGWYYVSFMDRADVYRDMHFRGQGVPIELAWPIYIDEEEDLGTEYMFKISEILSHRVPRVAGDNRYDTAIKMASKFGYADTAIIASGEGFPDALAAASLAGAYDAPILLTPGSSLPSGLITCLDNLGVQDVIVVGGTSVVSQGVYNQLGSHGYQMSRIAGSDRYQTARAIAIQTINVMGTDHYANEPFLVRGDQFADALAVAPFAYREARPILLTEPDKAPSATVYALDWMHTNMGTDTVYVIGGQSAVGDQALYDLWTKVYNQGDFYFWRAAGNNRYDTAARCVSEYWGWNLDIYTVASGESFPDALSAGPLMGKQLGGVLLTPRGSLANEARSQLYSDRIYIWDVLAAGGKAALADAVLTSISSTLGTSQYDMDGYSGVSAAMEGALVSPSVGLGALREAAAQAAQGNHERAKADFEVTKFAPGN